MKERLTVLCALLAFVLGACAGGSAVSPTEAPGTTAGDSPEDGIQGGTTFSGEVTTSDPGVSGGLSFRIADSGDGITEAVLNVTFDNYACGPGKTMSGGGSTLTWNPPIPIDNGRFESRQFSGAFDSQTLAHGTIDVMAVYECPGIIVWTAEAVE